MTHLVLGLQDRRERCHLRLPVEVPEPDVRQPLLHLAEHLDRHRRGAVVPLAQRGQIGLVEGLRAKQRDPDGRRREQLRCALGLDRVQQQVGVWAGEDDARRAEVDIRAEEAVQLGAVIERKRVHLDVVGRHPAVDDAAHVLRDDGAAGELHALRPRLGAARVHQPQRIVIADDHLRWPVVRVLRPSGDVLPTGRRRLSRQVDPAAYAAVHAGRDEAHLGGRMQRVLDDEPGGARVLEDKRDLVGAEHEVDRHHHGAQARERKVEHRVLPAVVRQHAPPAVPVRRRRTDRAQAVRFTASSNSAKLHRTSPETSASFAGCRSAERRSRSAMPCTRACCTALGADRLVIHDASVVRSSPSERRACRDGRREAGGCLAADRCCEPYSAAHFEP